MTTESIATAVDELQSRLPGVVFLPGSREYGELSRPWNVAVPQHPAAVAEPRSAAETAHVVREAAALGLRVAPQSTGHAASALANTSLDDVVLVRLTGMRSVSIDAERRIARVGGGAVWDDVVGPAAAHGLAAHHGSAGDVGVVGYALAGGLSWLARSHGLAANHIRSVQLVTAAGAILNADENENADVFWALRGGNAGNFGIVTALEIGLVPLQDAYAGMLLWSIEHTEPVLRAWHAWASTAPEAATTSLRVMRFPPIPELPPFLSGRSLVVVDGVFLGSDEEAIVELKVLRDLQPEMDTFARIPAAALTQIHMDPPEPSPAVGGGALVDALDEAGIVAFLAAVGPDAQTALTFAELRQLGGAVARPVGEGALTSFDAAYALYAVTIAPHEQAAMAGLASVEALRAALKPWLSRRTYLNFTEGETAVRDGFEAESYARLKEIRDQLDPDRVLVANHPIV